jgi:CDP-2,3-bis-(O-geranylgeranyl)-sn-glycerol synthase
MPLRIAQLLYLMAPAYLANMTPPFARFWRGWNRPINARRLGSHKTAVGAVGGVIVATAVALLQSRLAWRGGLVDYDRWPLVGLLLGVGAMGGDIAKSYVKRRLGIAPGSRWIPADQLDFVIGALVLIAPMARIGWLDVSLVLLISFVGDLAVNQVAFRLGVRDTAW